MRRAMSGRKRGLVVVGGLVGAATVVAVVGFALFSSGGPDDGVVSVIEGIEVTEEEWAEAMAAEPDPMTSCLREMAETMDPAATADVRNSLAFMDELEGAHSPEAVLLGQMVIGLSTEAEARERGLEPTDAEVTESVARNREMTEAMLGMSHAIRRQVQSAIDGTSKLPSLRSEKPAIGAR